MVTKNLTPEVNCSITSLLENARKKITKYQIAQTLKNKSALTTTSILWGENTAPFARETE